MQSRGAQSSSSGANIRPQQEADAALQAWMTAADVVPLALPFSMALAHLQTVVFQTWCWLLSLPAALLHLGSAVASSQILKRSPLATDSSIHQYHVRIAL